MDRGDVSIQAFKVSLLLYDGICIAIRTGEGTAGMARQLCLILESVLISGVKCLSESHPYHLGVYTHTTGFIGSLGCHHDIYCGNLLPWTFNSNTELPIHFVLFVLTLVFY